MTSQRIIRTYLGVAATTTLAQSLIWGVNTLFLLSVGLDIFQVMLVNAAYTVAQVIFEVPTGVVADTVGRRMSYLLAVGTILVSTLLYVGFGVAGYGIWPFVAASALLGIGYTFYTGAVDAWMVDALHSVGYEGRLEPIFARYGIMFGVFMLIGTTLGWPARPGRPLDPVRGAGGRAGARVPARAAGDARPRLQGAAADRRQLRPRDEAHRHRRGHLRPPRPRDPLHHVRVAGAGRVLHVRVLLVAEVLPRPARQGPGLGHRRDRRARRAHADPGQCPRRADHGARPRPRPDPHGVQRSDDGGGHRRRAGAAVLDRRAAVPGLDHGLRHLDAGQAGMARTRASRRSSARPSSRWTRCSAMAAPRWGRSASAGCRRRVSIPFAWLVGGVVQAASVPLLGVARRAERAEPAGPSRENPGASPASRWNRRAASARSRRSRAFPATRPPAAKAPSASPDRAQEAGRAARSARRGSSTGSLARRARCQRAEPCTWRCRSSTWCGGPRRRRACRRWA